MDNRLIREALAFDMNKSKIEQQQLQSLLNPEQCLIYEHVIQSVDNQEGQFYFVYDPRGTGKIFLYKTIIARLRSKRMIVLVVASSGDGTVPTKKKEGEDEATWIEIRERFLIKSWKSPIKQIVQETYPDFTTRQHDDEYLK
ncbi:ATP-dependent DNA helicase PIF1-like protein [Tanacetum coccineum]